MHEQKRLSWIKVLSFLAILLSLYLTYLHYQPVGTNTCFFGEAFNCNVINTSPYATLGGIFYFLHMDLGLHITTMELAIPNAVLALLIFLFIYMAAHSVSVKKPFLGMGRKGLLKAMRVLLYVSLIYAIYLAYIECFILLNYCIACIALDLIIVAILLLVVGMKKQKPARRKRK